jgi:hypothetical protein
MEDRSSERVRILVTQMARRGLSANENACALISMVARSKSSNQRPDTLMQDRKPQLDENLLQRTAGPYIHLGSFTSALACSRHVGLLGNLGSGPLAECL